MTIKLNEYIDSLLAILKEHGNLDLVYASDSEGNNFSYVCYTPSIGCFDGEEFKNISDDDESTEINCCCVN